MRIFIAGLHTETNTFSPMPTGLASFTECLLAHGDATRRPLTACSTQLKVWRELSQARGFTVIEGLCAMAEPGGITGRVVYESFREEILNNLHLAGAVDAVLVSLHGAMVAEGYDDVEGDLLTHIREQVGAQTPIGAELDLHCHLTESMTRSATALVLYKEYPHVDIDERAAHLFSLIVSAAERRVVPVMQTFDCRMIGLFRTQDQPMRAFVDRLRELEACEGILSVSLCHGFPWGDVREMGARILVVADESKDRALNLARALGLEFYAMREQLRLRHLTIDEALDRVAAAPGGKPVILADVSDNAGGGAPSDSTFMLQRILKRGITDVASALHWDPVAVRLCQEAGEGARFTLRVGGKVGVVSGAALDLDVEVRRLVSAARQQFGRAAISIGDAAWVHTAGIDIVLNTQRTQVFHPGCMTELGIDLASRRAIVVKSTNHFFASFAPISGEVHYVDAPGALSFRFEDIVYRKVKRTMWPVVTDPLAQP